MAPSLRLSDEGKALIDQARRRKAWTKTSASWMGESWELLKQRGEKITCPSAPTLQRFQAGIATRTESFQAFCEAVGVDWKAVIRVDDANEQVSSPLTLETSAPFNLDPYEGIPKIDRFYGRIEELQQLHQAMNGSNRLILIYGFGGIGKTQLVAKFFLEHNAECFTRRLWQAFSYTLPLEDLLANLVIRLCPNINLPTQRSELVSRLVKELQREPTLLILDEKNSDEESNSAESYSTGYKRYCTLLQQISLESHQSCVVLTTQQKPEDTTAVIGSLAKAFNLKGLDDKAGCELLKDKGLVFDEQTGKELLHRYRGNPLLLQLVVSVVRDIFKGDVRSFLTGSSLSLYVPAKIETILQQVVKRLSDPEKEILCYLANLSTRASLSILRQELPQISYSCLIRAIHTLEYRSLLEKESEERHYLYTLQPVIMKFIQQGLM